MWFTIFQNRIKPSLQLFTSIAEFDLNIISHRAKKFFLPSIKKWRQQNENFEAPQGNTVNSSSAIFTSVTGSFSPGSSFRRMNNVSA